MKAVFSATSRRRILTATFIALGASHAAFGADLRVPADHATIARAVEAAVDGDRILVAPGRYEITSPIRYFGKAIIIESEGGAAETVIAMGEPADPQFASVIAFDGAEPPEATLRGFTITGGRGTRGLHLGVPTQLGGGIYCGTVAAPLIEGNIITENTANHGAGIHCVREAQPRLVNNSIRHNRAEFSPCPNCFDASVGGGLSLEHDSRVSIHGGEFVENEAADGAAIGTELFCQLVVEDVEFIRNTASDDGGAIRFRGDEIRLLGSTFRENRSNDRGGAMRFNMFAGGVIPAPAPQEATIRDCHFEGNTSANEGGAVSIFLPNGAVEVVASTFIGNSTMGMGGGLHIDYQTRGQIDSCTFLHNRAGANGGGLLIDYEASGTLTNCLLSGNRATTGGGISAGGGVLVSSSTIAGNAAARGGGLFLDFSAPVSITGTILYENAGGSIFGRQPAVHITHSCISPTVLDFAVHEDFGPTNQYAPPRFEGWTSDEVFVDGTADAGGDGSAGAPYRRLMSALSGFSHRLGPGSPCIGTGPNGENIGARVGVAETMKAQRRTVHLAAGEYDLRVGALAHRVSLRGANARTTTLFGSVLGLRDGEVLDNVTVTHGASGGVTIGSFDDPLVEGCRIVENLARYGGGGVTCGDFAEGNVVECHIENNLLWGYFHRFFLSSAGVAAFRSQTTFSRCHIVGNRVQLGAPIAGAPVAHGVVGADGVRFENCLIAGAPPTEVITGSFDNAGPSLVNCTVVGHVRGGRLLNTLVNGTIAVGVTRQFSLATDSPAFVHPGGFDFDRHNPVEIGGMEFALPDHVVDPGDYRLQPGSPGINAGGLEGAPAEDIAGNTRPCGGGVDLGAYESDCSSAPFWRGDSNSDGERNVADAIATLNELFANGFPARCADAADMNDDGGVNIADPVYLLNFLFGTGSAPPEPTEACGMDPTDDPLPCSRSPNCL